MAAGKVLTCSSCSHSISAWDDGNPFYWDEKGKKRYAYHPDPKRSRCTGNDSPVLCLHCGRESMSDSETPTSPCPPLCQYE